MSFQRLEVYPKMTGAQSGNIIQIPGISFSLKNQFYCLSEASGDLRRIGVKTPRSPRDIIKTLPFSFVLSFLVSFSLDHIPFVSCLVVQEERHE